MVLLEEQLLNALETLDEMLLYRPGLSIVGQDTEQLLIAKEVKTGKQVPFGVNVLVELL